MDCGSFKIYLKNGTTSISVNASSWKSSLFSSKPDNLDLSHKFGGSVSAQSDDNAISLNGRINADNGDVYFTQVNHFGGNITSTARYNLIIVEFIA